MMPTTSSGLDDDALLDFFHDFIVSVTGLAGKDVIPRWQPDPPNMADFGADWCGFGISEYRADTFAAIVQVSTNTSEFRRHELVELLLSFYGENCGRNARLMRDQIQVPQNYEQLDASGVAIVEGSDVTYLPTLLKERWTKRADIKITIRRQEIRSYNSSTILVGQGLLDNERYVTPINAP